jgi:hypothetical protein
LDARTADPFLLLGTALAGCAQLSRSPRSSRRAAQGFDTNRGDPVAAMDGYVAAAESAWRNRARSRRRTRRDYNFAVARSSVRCAVKLAPWSAPISPVRMRAGSFTRCRSESGTHELIPTDQLDIRGAYVDERRRDGLGAPLVAKRRPTGARPHFLRSYRAYVLMDRAASPEDPLSRKQCESRRMPFRSLRTTPCRWR